MKNFYELLGLAPTATADEIKKSFRQEIARYHPDKVQHLGAEFQEMAASRAAQLTEAYRTLMDEASRAAYDAQLDSGDGAATVAPPPKPARPAEAEPAGEPSARPAEAGPAAAGGQFTQERERRDLFLRRAALARFRRAVELEFGNFECPDVRGFDIACVSKPKLFGRRTLQRVLARFIDRVDGPAITETLALAAKAGSVWTAEELSVFVLGASLAPARELAEAIAEQRKRPPRGVAGRIVIVPVDARDWNALIPQDAPPLVRTLADRLKKA